MIEVRVLRIGSMHVQTARKRFDDNGVDALALASSSIPHGTVDRLGMEWIVYRMLMMQAMYSGIACNATASAWRLQERAVLLHASAG